MISIRFFPALCAVFLLAVCATEDVSAQTSGGPNILVIGEDADTDTAPRNNRVFDRVLRAIQGKMNEAGFNVFDETAITLGVLAQDRVRRDDGEIIEVCRAVRTPPLDVAVIFSIWPDTRRSDIATYVSARVEGRLLNCRSGQFLGHFEQKFESVTLPLRCSRGCVLESVGEQSKVIGRDVALVLARKLAWLLTADAPPLSAPSPSPSDGGLPMQFTLVFDNFTSGEVNRVEEYLAAFGGYRSHRLIDGSATRQRVWYETTGGDAKLRRNLSRMLESEGIEAVTSFTGNTFTVEKIGLRRRAVNPDDFR